MYELDVLPSLGRTVYREDLQKLKKKLSKQSKQTASTEEVGKGRAISAATSDAVSGKRNAVPESYLTMEFVHGLVRGQVLGV